MLFNVFLREIYGGCSPTPTPPLPSLGHSSVTLHPRWSELCEVWGWGMGNTLPFLFLSESFGCDCQRARDLFCNSWRQLSTGLMARGGDLPWCSSSRHGVHWSEARLSVGPRYTILSSVDYVCNKDGTLFSVCWVLFLISQLVQNSGGNGSIRYWASWSCSTGKWRTSKVTKKLLRESLPPSSPPLSPSVVKW